MELFDRLLKDELTEEVKRKIDSAILHLSRKCFKQCENAAFNQFFRKFKHMFPVIQERKHDGSEDDFGLIREKRHEQKDIVEYVTGYSRSESG